jgi:hypothetical protein
MYKKNIVILFAVCIAVIIVISLFAPISPFGRVRSRSVIRNFNTTDEKRALTAAETANYGSIMASKRFEGRGDPEAYIHSGTYAYTWANFIDSEIIDYYQKRYNHQQKQITPRVAAFKYSANVTYLEQLHIFNTTIPEQGYIYKTNDDSPQEGLKKELVTWNVRTIAFCGPDASTPLLTFKPFTYTFYSKNQSEYQTLPAETDFDLNFSNCYLVEMELEYNEVYAPLAAFFLVVHQIVVLDQNLVPIWIGINAGHGIS